MKKKIMEDCYILSISDLRQNDLLPTDLKPVLKTIRVPWDKNEQRVVLTGIRIDTSIGEAGVVYLDNIYPPSGIKQTQVVKLITTPCNYGNVRYRFVCPCYRGGNGGYCNRKVDKLYLPLTSYEFGCRHCHNLSYASRNVTRPDRDGLMWQHFAERWSKKPKSEDRPNSNKRRRGKGKYSLDGLREQFEQADLPDDVTFCDYFAKRAYEDNRIMLLALDMLLPDAE